MSDTGGDPACWLDRVCADCGAVTEGPHACDPRQAPTPGAVGRLVVITGLPGSGKTQLAVELAASLPAVRMCPDDWMMSAGIDLWDASARQRIEAFQLELSLDLLRAGTDVVIEWGVWTHAERDALREAGHAVGACVELRHLHAPVEELWRRIEARDSEGRWGARSITRAELETWWAAYEVPSEAELATYDPPR